MLILVSSYAGTQKVGYDKEKRYRADTARAKYTNNCQIPLFGKCFTSLLLSNYNILSKAEHLILLMQVRFFYSFTCRDNLYLVMEYLNGGDLYSLLQKVGCLDEEIARIYIAELVS